MTLTVENGSIVAGANSYVSEADVDTYHSARLQTTWTGTSPEKAAAILKAMTFVENKSFIGDRVSALQPLSWPRSGAVIDGISVPLDTIPQLITDAVSELALRALTGDLTPDFGTAQRTKRVQIEGAITKEYFNDGRLLPTFSLVTNLLRPLIVSRHNLIRS